jgi:preprotein translocase subunit SecG
MLTLVTIIHLMLAIGLIVFVLLQDSKGGGAFGIGASTGTQGIFGASGAGNFLVTGTKWLAILFASTCLTLSYLTVAKDESLTEGYQAPAVEQTTQPAAPAAEGQDAKPDAKQ